jgi:hypothetical protein
MRNKDGGDRQTDGSGQCLTGSASPFILLQQLKDELKKQGWDEKLLKRFNFAACINPVRVIMTLKRSNDE